MSHEEIAERLAALAAGTLPPEEARALEAHLGGCPGCRRSLAAWRQVAAASRAAESAPAAAPRAVLERVRREVAEPLGSPGLGLLVDLVAAQIPIVRRQVWAASALVTRCTE